MVPLDFAVMWICGQQHRDRPVLWCVTYPVRRCIRGHSGIPRVMERVGFTKENAIENVAWWVQKKNCIWSVIICCRFYLNASNREALRVFLWIGSHFIQYQILPDAPGRFLTTSTIIQKLRNVSSSEGSSLAENGYWLLLMALANLKIWKNGQLLFGRVRVLVRSFHYYFHKKTLHLFWHIYNTFTII